MNTLIVFAIAITVAVAKPQYGQHVSVNQDTLGNYNFKYLIDGISRVENRDIHGNVNGGYSYIDPYGIERKIAFTSGAHGFNAIGADVPIPVQDTPEVAHAKAAHLATLHAAYLTAPPQPLEFVSPHAFVQQPLIRALPVASLAVSPAFHQALRLGAVPETPEVAAARAEHLAIHAAARSNIYHHLREI